ncbi:hypothetical protein Moror_9555 [Moniliophthora roreri MCA 2997]|uniref:CxC2-like cysteine cluster KDZ transposase-associated domain-containing protein n=1 Tax=Moniliophthora roreri (strain MCA 2997) TaxID=1381753 RepID=V2XBQ1_MONRO|nr:hypothetical protein Moror_9555 [Moniliophthora roreri MCA 2997]
MPPKGFKVKAPTAAQVQKEDTRARSKKQAEDNKKLSTPVKEEKMKVTDYTKDTDSLEVEYTTLSPSKKRIVHLADILSSSSSALPIPPSDIIGDHKEEKPLSGNECANGSTEGSYASNPAYIALFNAKNAGFGVCVAPHAWFHDIMEHHSTVLKDGMERHGGDSCPNSKKTFKWLTLVHVNGIVDILVNFCLCSEHPDDFDQLLDLCLFPATIERVETVFSFELLDDFHLHTLTSKKAAFDYYDALQCKTNPLLPQNAPNLYQPFLHIARIHRHLAGKCRAGQSHDIDKYVPHRPEGRTAVYCPACPEPRFNVDILEIQNTPLEKR